MSDIVEAINKSRSSRPLAVHVVDEDSDEEETMVAVHEVDEDRDEEETMVAVHEVDEDSDEEETMDVELETNDVELETNDVELEKKDIELEKKFLAVNNITELKAIVAKEKIVMGPGRKNKTDFINAIYSARHVNNA